MLAEEILWAGDRRTADKFKSVITAHTVQIERKHGSCRAIPNRLHVIMTTNHEHAIAAGVGDRRFVVLEVSNERASDKAYFDRLYRDLDDGGTGEFLDFLQRIKLEGWHPRQILKTTEATEQQRMSGDSVSEWSQASIDADAITGPGPYADKSNLGTFIPSEALRQAYTGYCKQHGRHPISEVAFGKACTEMFGPRRRATAQQTTHGNPSKRRPWGYDVPDGNTWDGKVDARLGIKQ
jgi:hypothetical protein